MGDLFLLSERLVAFPQPELLVVELHRSDFVPSPLACPVHSDRRDRPRPKSV